jgi:hypothetical protein
MRLSLVGVLLAGLLVLPGCPSPEGNIITAVGKVAGGAMSTLTGTEIQVLVDQVAAVRPDLAVELTDEQAAAAAQFLKDNNLNTVDDIAALIENPGDLVIPESLLALAESDSVNADSGSHEPNESAAH